jgi:hypothetical protein
MRDRYRLLLRCGLIAALVATPPAAAFSQVIFIDPCGITIPPFTTGQLTVWVCVEGQIFDGITSAQFRIAGLPSGWEVTVVPTGNSVSAGDLSTCSCAASSSSRPVCAVDREALKPGSRGPDGPKPLRR